MLNILSKTIQPETFFSPKKGIQLYQLINKNGIEVLVTNYGIRLVSLFTPDKNGELDDIVLGYDTLHEFETKNPFMNSIIGRVANRIENGQLDIDGKKFQVGTNLNQHCLHGGTNGLHQQIWEVKYAESNQILFYHFSKSGSEGFPGNLEIEVLMELTDQDELKIKYKASTDQPTPVNLTYHPYFNLSGSKNEQIGNHLLQIKADEITDTNEELIPTGNFNPIANTPFNFSNEKRIGKDILSTIPDMKKCGGYDHNFILRTSPSPTPFFAAKLSEPNSKRSLEIWTTQPGLQLYTSNGVDDIGKGNIRYGNHSAVCLEPQHFPNSVNISHFPTTIVTSAKPYSQECIFKFGLI